MIKKQTRSVLEKRIILLINNSCRKGDYRMFELTKDIIMIKIMNTINIQKKERWQRYKLFIQKLKIKMQNYT